MTSTVVNLPVKSKPLFISVSDLLARPIVIRKLIGRIIERGCTGQIFGPSGDGKSFVVVDWLLSIATGIFWNGHKCEQGLTFYFAGEGHSGILRRVAAWTIDKGITDIRDAHISEKVITIDGDGVRQVVAEVREIEQRTGKQVALIVIDTLARHILGDENSTRDMSEFVREVDSLRNMFPGSSVVIVHHTGNDAEKQGRSRGSSALKAACDFEVQCLKGTLTFTKMKDSAAPPPIDFKLIPVVVGTDEETGKPITSCVLEYGEKSFQNRQANKVKMTLDGKRIMEIFTKTPGIDIDEVRQEFYRQKLRLDPDEKQGTLRKAFSRGVDTLTRDNFLTAEGVPIQEGQRDKAGQSATMSRNVAGQDGTQPYRGVPVVPHLSGLPEVEAETLANVENSETPNFDF